MKNIGFTVYSPFKNRKNKTSFGEKQFWERFRRCRKIKKYKPNLKNKLRIHMDTNILSFNTCKLDIM